MFHINTIDDALNVAGLAIFDHEVGEGRFAPLQVAEITDFLAHLSPAERNADRKEILEVLTTLGVDRGILLADRLAEMAGDDDTAAFWQWKSLELMDRKAHQRALSRAS